MNGLRSARALLAMSCTSLVVALAACDGRREEAATRVPGAPDAPPPATGSTQQSAPASASTRRSGAPADEKGSGVSSSTGRSAPAAGATRSSLGGKAVSAADVEFVSNAASACTLEVEASRVALEKSKTPAVRTFAQKLIDEHSRAGDELRALNVASSVGNVAALSPKDGEQVRKLRELEGRAFDREYVAQIGVAEHQEAIGAFQQAAATAADVQVKTFAQAKLPALREHLEIAQSLAKQVGAGVRGGQGPAASGRTRGGTK